jgi:tetratricopeptide (TPR) repeat protein
VPKLKILNRCLLLLLSVAVGSYQTTAQRSRRPANKSTPQTQNSPPAATEFDRLVKLADDARSAERLDEAVNLYTQALKIKPSWPDGWWYLGAIFYEQDLYARAADAFQNLVVLDAQRGPGWGMLGLCQFQLGDYERAVITLQRARTLGLTANRELESVVRYHTALLYIHFAQFEIAYEILREFMSVGNESPKVVEAFGLTMLRMPFLPKDIPAEKRDAVMLAGQAGYDMAARRLEPARVAFNTLVARFPNEPNVHYSFGVYLLTQDADAALKEFQRELQISPQHYPAMTQMAFEYLKRDQYNDALPLAEKAVQLAPKMFAARNVLGRVLLELGQTDRAIQELEEGVKLAPSSPEMHYALSRAYTRTGRKADANRERETFLKLQEQYNKQRDAQTQPPSDSSQDKPKPK